MKKKNVIFIIIFSMAILIYLYFSNQKKGEVKIIKTENSEDISYSSNIIENVNYTSIDAKGNEYIIRASQGEIDFKQSNIIYLKNVKALIKLTNSNDIEITSKYGKYNTDNINTIFSKDVIISYLNNKISGEYLDFSLERNSMIISRKVIFTNLENILKADVIEINISNKDTKIFMHKDNKKVNIKTIR